MGIELFCSIKDVLPLVCAREDPIAKYDVYTRLKQTCKMLFEILKDNREIFLHEFTAKPLFAKNIFDLTGCDWVCQARLQCSSLKNWMHRTPQVLNPISIPVRYTAFIACHQGLKVFNVDSGLRRMICHQTKWTDFLLPISRTLPFNVDDYIVFPGQNEVLVYDRDEEQLIYRFQTKNGTDIKAIRNGKVFIRDNDRYTKDYPLSVYDIEKNTPSKKVILPNTFDIRFGKTHLFCMQSVDGKYQFSGIELNVLNKCLDENMTPEFVQGDLSFPDENCNTNVFIDGDGFALIARIGAILHVYKVSFSENRITFCKIPHDIPLSPFHFCKGHYYHENRLFVALIENDLLAIRLFDLETGADTPLYAGVISSVTQPSLDWDAACSSRVHFRLNTLGSDYYSIITFDYTK